MKTVLTGLCGVALAGFLSAGCASDPPPPDDTGKPIPLVAAPSFDYPNNLRAYPDLYRRGKCILVASKGELSDEEYENYVDAFSETFFGACFTSIDPDIMNKARERASVFTGVPPNEQLTRMANEAKCDFTVYISLAVEERALEASDQVDRRDVSGKMRANATVTLAGSAAKSTKEQTTTLKLDQIFSSRSKHELQGRLAKLMGKAIAEKILSKVAEAAGVAEENVIDLTFKHYNNDKTDIRDILLDIDGIEADSFREVSAPGSAQFIFRVHTSLNMNALRLKIEDAFEDADLDAPSISQPSPNMLLFSGNP